MQDDHLNSCGKIELHILHAGNISKLMSLVAVELRKQHPDILVTREKGGSVDLVKKISLHNEKADIIATADYRNIEQFLYGSYADWYGTFLTTHMVLAYTDLSKYSAEISTDNWHDVITRPGIRIKWGDPNVDPGAYRRIMIGKLAEKFYGQPGLAEKIEANVMRPDPGTISHAIPQTKSGQVDYMFMYRPAAISSGLKYVALPPQVSLGNAKYTGLYRSVETMSSGVMVKGDMITYGITVPKNAAHADNALLFIDVLLSPEGTRIIQDCGFSPIKPFHATGDIPSLLKRYL
jgi:molybdate/tungstate transport system substrate-binding protein